jgi:hypothetical protein
MRFITVSESDALHKGDSFQALGWPLIMIPVHIWIVGKVLLSF